MRECGVMDWMDENGKGDAWMDGWDIRGVDCHSSFGLFTVLFSC